MLTAAREVTVQAIGECMIEVARTASGARVTHAGDTYNTAVYLARVARLLEASIQVRFLTGAGDDEESARMRAAWRANGVVDDSLTVHGAQPGLYLVSTDDQGERRFSYWRRGSAAAQALGSRAWLERVVGDVIYLSGITLHLLPSDVLEQLVVRLQALRDEGSRVVFDSNYRTAMWPKPEHARWAFDSVLGVTDMALVTWDDEKHLAGDADLDSCASRLVGLGVAEVVIKDGPNGAWVYADGIRHRVATEPVEAIDTTAAGDSFNGAYLAARLSGRTPVEAARLGNAVARCVVQQPGAIIDPHLMPAALPGRPDPGADVTASGRRSRRRSTTDPR